MAVVETVTFRLTAGTDEADFLAVDKRVQTDFAYQQPGMLRRTTARGADGEWIVIMLWRAAADAEAAAARAVTDAVTARFAAMVDAASVQTRRYELLD
jgi:hypothetical protein